MSEQRSSVPKTTREHWSRPTIGQYREPPELAAPQEDFDTVPGGALAYVSSKYYAGRSSQGYQYQGSTEARLRQIQSIYTETDEDNETTSQGPAGSASSYPPGGSSAYPISSSTATDAADSFQQRGWSAARRHADYDFGLAPADSKGRQALRFWNATYAPVDPDACSFRKKWKTGIACNQWLSSNSVPGLSGGSFAAHWGIWISDAADQDHMCKIYGLNFTDSRRQDLMLEAVWGVYGDVNWVRDLQESDLQKVPMTECVMYFSFTEFVLIAQYLLRLFAYQRLPASSTSNAAEGATATEMLTMDNSGDAYSLLMANCQHWSSFARQWLHKNGWQNSERGLRRFSLDLFAELYEKGRLNKLGDKKTELHFLQEGEKLSDKTEKKRRARWLKEYRQVAEGGR